MAAPAAVLDYLNNIPLEHMTPEERDMAEGDPVFFIYNSGKKCARCDDKIMLTDELFCLEVVLTTMYEGQPTTIFATSEDGDYLYAPHFFEIDCWEESYGELCMFREDSADADLGSDLAILECSICNSGILLDEIYAQATFGELRCSQREPEGGATHTFARLNHNTHSIICIACLKYMNDDIHQLWEEGVDQEGECEMGTLSRCWRYGCDEETCAAANQLADEEDDYDGYIHR